MRVVILGTTLAKPLVGMGRFSAEIVRNLTERYPSNEYLVVHPGTPAFEAAFEFGGLVEPLPMTRPLRHLRWKALHVVRAAERMRPDIILSPGHLYPFFPRPRGSARRVQTVHDLTPLVVPGTHKLSIQAEFRLVGARSLDGVAGIVTPSSSSRRDVLEHYPASRRKPMAIVPYGVSPHFFQPTPLERRLPERYFLVAGSMEPRKNLRRTLQAFAEYVEAGGDAHLVIAGPLGWRYRSILRALADPRLAGRVRLIGYVPDREMPALYAHALALLYPSLYEGFGLPVVEAMAAGCPVVSSDCSSIPEVAGGAALLIDPRSVPALRQAIERMAEDDALRRRLREQGRARVEGMTWMRTAEGFQAFFEKVADGSAETATPPA